MLTGREMPIAGNQERCGRGSELPAMRCRAGQVAEAAVAERIGALLTDAGPAHFAPVPDARRRPEGESPYGVGQVFQCAMGSVHHDDLLEQPNG